MKKLDLKNLKQNLQKFDKILVTGPPRSGTTISGIIISDILNYKFIDESFYDSNNSQKFMFFLSFPKRKMVIQTTAFIRDLYTISDFLFNNKIAIILIRRNIKDILESFENSKNFKKGFSTSNGIFTAIDEEAQNILLNHYKTYVYKNDNRSLPEIIYDCFDANKYCFCNKMLFELDYENLSNHKLFIKKEERRKKFEHLKQVNEDPYYLSTKKGIMIL